MAKLTAHIILVRIGSDFYIPSRKIESNHPLGPRITADNSDPYPTFSGDIGNYASGEFSGYAGSGLYSGAVYSRPLNKGEVTFEYPPTPPNVIAGFGVIDGWRVTKTFFPTRSTA